MSCDNTTLYVYVSTLSGTVSDTISYDSLTGSLSGSFNSETLVSTIDSLTGIGAGELQVSTISASTLAISATIVGSLNDVVNTPLVQPSTGTVSGNFDITQQYASLYDFTGVVPTTAATVSTGVLSLTSINLTGGTVNGNNYNTASTESATITSGTLSAPGMFTVPTADAVADEYVEGVISTSLFTDKNVYGTVSKTTGSDSLTITITAIGQSGYPVVENHPYDVYTLSSIPVTGGEITSTLSGFSTTATITGGALSSSTIATVLTGFGLTNHTVVGELQTTLGTFPASASLTKSGDVWSGSTSNVDGQLTVSATIRSLSSIPVNGGYGINPGSAFAAVSGVSLMEVISSGSISSTTDIGILTSDTATQHFITGTINTSNGSLYETPVSGHITTSTDGTYSGVLTSIAGNMVTSVNVYQLSSIPLTGSVTGTLSGETLNIDLTSGSVSSNLALPYILTDEYVTSVPVTGVANGSIDISGSVTTTTNGAHTVSIDSVGGQLIDIPTYSLSSVTITGGALTDTQTNSAWVNDHSISVSITGGSLSTTHAYVLTGEPVSSAITTGTLSTNFGLLTASIDISTTAGNTFIGNVTNVQNVAEVTTIVPTSSFDTQFIIETETVSSGDTLSTVLTGDLSGSETLNDAIVVGYISPTIAISGTVGTTTTTISSLLSSTDTVGNFYTLYGGGMLAGAGTEHSMTVIPITGGVLSGVNGCLSITKTLTGGVLSSASSLSLALSSTFSNHTVDGYGLTDAGESIELTGTITKSESGDRAWTGVLSSTGGISNISEITYNLAPLSTATGVIIGSLSGESVSADITSSLLSSLTLTYLLTCDNALSNHAITGTVTTDAGTASISGSIDTTGNTYTGIVSVEQYPVSIPAYSLLTIPVTGATWKDTSTSYSILSNFSTVGGTLSSTSLTYLLTSENVTGHEVQGVLTSNAMTVSNISPVNVTGTISTTGNNYTMELSSTPISSHIDTSPVISAFPRKELNIGRGYTYTFILTTPWPNFDTFKLSTSQDGEHTGGEEYITNVAGFEGSAPGDEIRLKVTPETPSTLYYYSSLTPDAGSVINITDACSIADDGSFVTDASTAPVTDKQTIASKRPKVKFIFNNQDLSDLELFNDTKYTFFVNNSSDSTFSFNNETGDDASLGSPRQVSNNRTTQGVVTFAKQTNRSAITINNNQETGGGSSFKGSIGDTEVKTTTPPAASETGDVANTNITSPPGATAPDYAKVSVDCEAEELFRNIPHGTTYKIPIYSRTRTNVYTYVQSRTWEYPEWTFVGELTSARAGSSLTFTSSAEGRDPIAVNGSGTLNEATYTYTWDGTASNSEGLTGRGSATIGLNPNGGETGAIYGTWDTRYNDMPVVSGTDSWSLESTSFTAVPASAVSVSPTPGDYKARYAFSLHDIFTTETEPLVVSHGNRYDHESKIVIGPTDNDITIFTASEIYSNGVLFYDKNNSKAFLPIDSSADGNGINVIPRDKLIDTVKAGEVMTVYLSGSDGQNLWSAGVLAYLETVCLNTFDLKNINVDEVAYNEQTFNAGTSLDANISNALSAVSGSAMALTLTHIPGEIEGSHYKWYRGTDVIPGAIAATLNIPLFTINDNGNYSVSIETPYRFKQSQPVTITAHTFTEALAALIVEYDFATTYGITAGSGHLWTTPLMNVQIWRCVHTADNTLSAVQHVVNEDIAIEPYTDGRADVRMELSASTDTFLNGGTSELSALTGNALNWHFAANNANGTPLITLSGTPDDRLTDNINYGVLANNTPWNDASDAPIIENADSVFVVLMSTPVTGANPTFPILDGGQASIVPGDSATYTHFISQTGYKTTPGLTALNLSALQFTADTLTGAPLGRAYDYVFGYQPWSHHSSVSGIGLSGSTGNTKIIGLTGFNADGGYYTNGSTVSATFLSLKSKSTYTYLTATSTYAITGDDVYPDTTFHMSTRPALSGSVNIDIYNGNAYDSALNHKIRLYELMPTGVLSEDNWMVTREVIDWSGISWGMSQFNTSSLHTTAAVCHPFTESLTANTTGKVRYLYIDEYDGDVYESNDTQHDEIRSITIQTYTDTGDNRNGSTGAGGGDALPTWWYRTTSSSTPSGGSQTPVNGSANPMTIVNFPSLYNDYTTTSRNVEVFGLSATYPSSEGMTAGLSGINTMGSIHLNYEASRSAN